MRTIGIFLIIVILFSYFPMLTMDGCSEEDHGGDMRMDCGYTFHCPVIDHSALPHLSALSIYGWLRWKRNIGKMEELPKSIFRPPEDYSIYDLMGGMDLA